jgi:hypothetical protein
MSFQVYATQKNANLQGPLHHSMIPYTQHFLWAVVKHHLDNFSAGQSFNISHGMIIQQFPWDDRSKIPMGQSFNVSHPSIELLVPHSAPCTLLWYYY